VLCNLSGDMEPECGECDLLATMWCCLLVGETVLAIRLNSFSFSFSVSLSFSPSPLLLPLLGFRRKTNLLKQFKSEAGIYDRSHNYPKHWLYSLTF
jgi:hypothetical protein